MAFTPDWMLRRSTAALAVALLAVLAARAEPAPVPGDDESRAAAAPARTVAPLQPPREAADAGAIDRGRITYGFYCMNCHGGDGRGGRDGGSDLHDSAMLRAEDGGHAFAEFLPVGRPEQRMPPTPLEEDDIADLWAFLRVLVGAETTDAPAQGAGPIAGDAEEGAQRFRAAGCARCHSVTKDLRGIGARLDVAAIHERLLAPPATTRDAAEQTDRAAAEARRRHVESVKKLPDAAVRDLAAYLATLR